MTIVDTFITNFMNKNYIWRMCFLLLQYSCLKQSFPSVLYDTDANALKQLKGVLYSHAY